MVTRLDVMGDCSVLDWFINFPFPMRVRVSTLAGHLSLSVPFFFLNFPFGPRTLQVRAFYALLLMLLVSFGLLSPVLPLLLSLWHEAFSTYAISAFQSWLPVLGNHRPIKVPLKPGFYPSLFRVNSRICQYLLFQVKMSRGGRRCRNQELSDKDEARAEH